MIVKKREKPLQLRKLEALARRLPASHSKRTKADEMLARYEAGHRGEKALDYPLSFLPDEDLYIFHHLRLCQGSHYFQIDALLLTPSFLCIIEAKNIAGKVEMNDEYPQMVRVIEGREEAFPDPRLQVSRQLELLKQWLNRHINITVPVEAFVVITNERTVVKAAGRTHPIIPLFTLPQQFRKLQQKHYTTYFSKEDMMVLSDTILAQHTEHDIDILSQLQIPRCDLLTGAQCSCCFYLPLKWHSRKWLCPSCKSVSSAEHHRALQDYALLFSPIITNKEARTFLHISSSDRVKRMLQGVAAGYTGSTKARIYQLR